ncbi:hypothetical protein Glo7428_3199 [Gloeocapsa sp. PCC 7428]|uniref:DUF1499 domain-containing protein n=1 Tax=Gloeocapsa sp. PCC 7428 TaxID=1173026 RepID=UPI0002A5E203|nr:DUF1499 domain-containing protein [Gloeocapsa sp. PCC 7428]AFZ31685.1 hypothetical protein Glo7428_3199 [Gloeocapsa sp. PCC 7428]
MSTVETKSSSVFQRVLFTFIALLFVTFCALGTKIAFSGEPQLFAGTRPDNLGVHAGELAPCPRTPNCVSSQSQDTAHQIAPLTYNSTDQEAMARLKTVLQSFRRVKAIAQSENYIYSEFTIPVVGFVDDVEFLLDKDAKVIHVRSASRLGEGDLGVNRRRVETIRTKFNESAMVDASDSLRGYIS